MPVFRADCEHGLLVERFERAEIDQLDAGAGLLSHGRDRLQRLVHHHPVGDDRRVRAFLDDPRLADRHLVVPVGHRSLDRPVHLLVLEEEHRILVADRGPQQARGIGRGAGATTFSPGVWTNIASMLCEW